MQAGSLLSRWTCVFNRLIKAKAKRLWQCSSTLPKERYAPVHSARSQPKSSHSSGRAARIVLSRSGFWSNCLFLPFSRWMNFLQAISWINSGHQLSWRLTACLLAELLLPVCWDPSRDVSGPNLLPKCREIVCFKEREHTIQKISFWSYVSCLEKLQIPALSSKI